MRSAEALRVASGVSLAPSEGRVTLRKCAPLSGTVLCEENPSASNARVTPNTDQTVYLGGQQVRGTELHFFPNYLIS